MMADLTKKRTGVLRADPKFKEFIAELSRFKSFHEKDRIDSSRITEAIYNQYNKYPTLLEELKRAKLGRWQSK